MLKRIGSLATGVALLGLSGCGNTPAPPPEPKATPQAQAPPPPPPPPPPTTPPAPELSPEAKELKKAMDRRPRPERPTPETVLTANEPDQLVVQLGQAIADKKYQAIWEMLPAPYQNEIKTTVSDFAKKVDGKVYNQATTNFQLIVFALTKHKDMFFRHSIVDQLPIERAVLEKAWDPAMAVGEALLDSEIYDIEELRSIDFARFLAQTGPRIADQIPALASIYPMPQIEEALELLGSLKNVKASKVSGDDNQQIVKIEFEGRDPVEAEFVKVEGKWIPKIVQDNWPMVMEQLKSAMAMIPVDDGTEEGKKKANQFRGAMMGVNLGATLMASVDTDQRFDEYMRLIWKQATGSDYPIPAPKPGEQPKEGEAKGGEAKPSETASPSKNTTPPPTDKPAEEKPAEPAPAEQK